MTFRQVVSTAAHENNTMKSNRLQIVPAAEISELAPLVEFEFRATAMPERPDAFPFGEES